jgi:hypothetical protein
MKTTASSASGSPTTARGLCTPFSCSKDPTGHAAVLLADQNASNNRVIDNLVNNGTNPPPGPSPTSLRTSAWSPRRSRQLLPAKHLRHVHADRRLKYHREVNEESRNGSSATALRRVAAACAALS